MFTPGASSAYHWGEFIGFILAVAFSISIITFIFQIIFGIALIIAQPVILLASALKSVTDNLDKG